MLSLISVEEPEIILKTGPKITISPSPPPAHTKREEKEEKKKNSNTDRESILIRVNGECFLAFANFKITSSKF